MYIHIYILHKYVCVYTWDYSVFSFSSIDTDTAGSTQIIAALLRIAFDGIRFAIADVILNSNWQLSVRIDDFYTLHVTGIIQNGFLGYKILYKIFS